MRTLRTMMKAWRKLFPRERAVAVAGGPRTTASGYDAQVLFSGWVELPAAAKQPNKPH